MAATLGLVALSFLSACDETPTHPGSGSLDGTWEGTVVKPGEGQVWTLALHESGGSISGQGTAVFSTLVSLDEYQVTVQGGTHTGASVSLDLTGEPGPVYFQYDGTIVREDSIAGTVVITIVGTRTDALNLARR